MLKLLVMLEEAAMLDKGKAEGQPCWIRARQRGSHVEAAGDACVQQGPCVRATTACERHSLRQRLVTTPWPLAGTSPISAGGTWPPPPPGIAWCGANPDKMPRSLSLKEKAQIVRECQRPGATQSQVAAKWELRRSVVCRIWQQKEKLLADYEAGQSNGCHKRGREGKAPAVDRALFTWLKEKRAQGARLLDPQSRKKPVSSLLPLG
ncbi:unnamed protein product [Caretta caretta]